MIGRLTHEEINIACRNIGINLECGGCAENFYTGYNDPEHHNENCTCTRKAGAIQMLYTIVTEQDRLSFTEAVNHNLAQGWKLCGGPFITTFCLWAR